MWARASESVPAHLDRRRAVKACECLCEAFRRFVTVFERDVYDLFVGLCELLDGLKQTAVADVLAERVARLDLKAALQVDR